MNQRSLSICMFTNLFPPIVSGSSMQSAALSREHAIRGHRPFVITAQVDKSSPAYEEIDGVPVYRLSASRVPKLSISLNFPWLSYTFTPANLRRIETIFLRHRPDVIHLHNHMFDLAFSSVLMWRRFRVPLVITIHTMIRHTSAACNLLLYPADRVLLRHMVANQAQMLICPDSNIERYVHEAFPRRPTALVPYGITLPGDADAVMVEQLRRKHNLEDKRVILSLGHVIELRDRRDLIRALPTVRKAISNVVAVIVGAEATDTPRRLARQLGVEDAVIFAGHVPHAEVPAYLGLADMEMHLFYQNTPEKTSLGIASLEAMGAANVVLAAANEDTYGRGVLRNGENIVLVDPRAPAQLAQTIVGLLGHKQRCRAIGERARQTIQNHFSWETVCTRTIEVYEHAIRECSC